MHTELDAFLAPYAPEVQDLARRARALILAAMPDAVEQFDAPARLIGYGFDRTCRGLVCGSAAPSTGCSRAARRWPPPARAEPANADAASGIAAPGRFGQSSPIRCHIPHRAARW